MTLDRDHQLRAAVEEIILLTRVRQCTAAHSAVERLGHLGLRPLEPNDSVDIDGVTLALRLYVKFALKDLAAHDLESALVSLERIRAIVTRTEVKPSL